MKVEESGIKEVLNSMVDSIGKQNVELYQKLVEGRDIKKITDFQEFYFSLIYPHEQFLKGLIHSEISKSKEVSFLLIHSNFIEYQFNKIIVDVEGSACSSDKSRTIMRRLFDWFDKGERIEWCYGGEYTFHLPKKIFTTHDEIIEFYKGVENLYYGHYKKYLDALNKTLLKIKQNDSSESK